MMQVQVRRMEQITEGMVNFDVSLSFRRPSDAMLFQNMIRENAVITIGSEPVKSSLHKQRLVDLAQCMQATMSQYEERSGPIGVGVDLHKHFKMLESIIKDYQDTST